jgi:shikimate kinase
MVVGTSRSIQNLALIGFMGSGKSCVGRLVASQLRLAFVDTDHEIEQRTGLRIGDIFAQAGEGKFRELERQVLGELESRRGVVISTGGGLVAQPGNLESLKRHALVVCLWADPATIWRRVRRQSHRPLLLTPDPQETIRQLLAQRLPYYRQADVLLNTEMRSVRIVAQLVVHQFLGASCDQAAPLASPP